MICSIQSVDGLRWVEANVLLWSIVNPIHISWVIIWISYIHIYMHTRHVLNGTTFKSIRVFKWQSQVGFSTLCNCVLRLEHLTTECIYAVGHHMLLLSRTATFQRKFFVLSI
jgi:hypothetical protein